MEQTFDITDAIAEWKIEELERIISLSIKTGGFDGKNSITNT